MILHKDVLQKVLKWLRNVIDLPIKLQLLILKNVD
jgi:hypothetical protein